jgi:hypothetical protein
VNPIVAGHFLDDSEVGPRGGAEREKNNSEKAR